MELWLNMVLGHIVHWYGAWLSSTALILVTICLFCMMFGQDLWGKLGSIWFKWCLLGPLTLAWKAGKLLFFSLGKFAFSKSGSKKNGKKKGGKGSTFNVNINFGGRREDTNRDGRRRSRN
ncbi:hypothetical protein HOI18_03135 [Candidatus Uhrbacteria bacterium]|jgi:hypothetical protein|nr:hypothetical protein [Candidatus Uhrbacteria bacterium]